MKYIFSPFILSLILMVSSCGSDDSDHTVVEPANLEVEVDESESAQGTVTVTAIADNTNYFEFDFGDGSEAVRDDDGTLSYTYSESGSYTITVSAHATSSIFIEKSVSVDIGIETTTGPIDGYSTPESYADYDLVWQDEFDGTSLSGNWSHEIGTGSNGWGNNELQYYRSENTSVADGFLTITAKKESFGGQQYTSSRIITQGNQSFQYGRIDIRAVLPKGQGIWPALWMLGSNFSTEGWPYCGEIDIMELVGGAATDNTVHGTVHWDNNGSYASYGDSYSLSSGIFSDEFHVFSIIWNATTIKWYVDDELFNTIDITPAELDEFQNDFFFIFNVAVGGNWPGSPDSTTQFPQKMIVDYVRVFQEK